MKFSIITCTYNSEKYLQDNIDSVESQSFQDFEHIFIDGFSTDKTIEIIKKYKKKYPDKVKLFQFKPKGISNAMNHGIDESSGEYLIHLHSDDSFYNDNVLEKVNQFITKNDSPDWLYGKAKIINAKNNKSKIIPNKLLRGESKFWFLILLNNYLPHQSIFIKKELFDKYGQFDESLKNYMDLDLWLKLTKAKVNAKFIDEVICNFSIREDAQSTIGRGNDESEVLYKRYINNRVLIKLLSIFSRLYKAALYKMSIYKMK